MRPPSRLLVPAILVAALPASLTLGCDDPLRSTSPAAPATASAVVERSVFTNAFPFADAEHLVAIGTTLENLAAFCATGAQNFDQWERLLVTRPDGSQKLVVSGEDLHVLVWDVVADPCTLLETPHFTGTARIISNDSDVNLDGAGADASGFRVQGTVTDASGQEYHLSTVFQGVVLPEVARAGEPFEFIVHVNRILLTPIGG